VLNGILDDLYGNLVARIAAARHKSPERSARHHRQRPFTAAQALKAGLVTNCSFEDQAWSAIYNRWAERPRKSPSARTPA